MTAPDISRHPQDPGPFTVDRWAFDYYVSTRPRPEQVIWYSRERDREALYAMQERINRNPIRALLWRRPWRSNTLPNWRSLADITGWLRTAHDCADPSVGCSCTGGYRYPSR